jgi:hypothetical protein
MSTTNHISDANLLEKEIQTYEKHKPELLANNMGRFVLIKDEEVIEIFDTERDAIQHGYRHIGNEHFLVKEILVFDRVARFTSKRGQR